MRKLITISLADHTRLLKLINATRLNRRVPVESREALEGEMARAAIVPPDELPPDVVAMHSTVWIRDVDSEEVEIYQLVYPSEANVTRDRISVMAPVGTALLGYRVGDVIQWRVPSGTRRMDIIRVEQNTVSPATEPVETLA